ncbi:6828_t:CDS:1, partial [Racocetra fulgida]
PILEKPANMPSNSSEMSQDLLDFENQSPTSAYSSQNHQKSIQLILRDIAKAFRDAATEVAHEEDLDNQHQDCETNWVQ